MEVRNPLVAVFASLAKAAVLVPLLLIPVVAFRWLALPSEVALFYGVAAVVIAGTLAGRTGAFAFAAFPLSFLGAFVGYGVFVAIVSPPVNLLYVAIHATLAATAAWAAATRLMAKVVPEVRLESDLKRRCRMCGSRVGPRARHCWSCRASLNRIT